MYYDTYNTIEKLTFGFPYSLSCSKKKKHEGACKKALINGEMFEYFFAHGMGDIKVYKCVKCCVNMLEWVNVGNQLSLISKANYKVEAY